MLIFGAAGVAVVVIGFLLVTQVFGCGGSDSGTTTQPANTVTTQAGSETTSADAGSGAVNRAATRVAVFNGTTTSGLARTAADKLSAAGYKQVDPVTTAPDQAVPATQVYFDTGARAEGLDVAKALGVDASAVVAMDPNIRALGQNAPVAVVLGADQAQ